MLCLIEKHDIFFDLLIIDIKIVLNDYKSTFYGKFTKYKWRHIRFMNDCGVASMVLKIEETSKMLLDRVDF